MRFSSPFKADDVASIITSDSLIIVRKKFHFPNDLVMKVPKKPDRFYSPAPGFLTNLLEKWEKLKDLSIPLHVRVEDLLMMLNLPDVDILHYEVHYLTIYVNEEYLFKMGLYTQAGRSHTYMLKNSAKVMEVVIHTLKVSPKRSGNQSDPKAFKKKKLLQRMDLEIELTKTLKDWNNEIVKVKYLQGEYK
ncbi:hypothetical protein IEQ34_019245 [Dendrobium chrysotoxum]|uniref:Uncharacterized protein n=1 Tax=Dendrobium chrysotoxum TaxID=161865 RepID=A0AAV7G6J2_DENCH|nr:hypothetical protein IEQ34_019245 [Dendrobium chrysotoxum]